MEVNVASFESIIRTLNEAGVRFIVVGGIAVIAHGYGRNTRDVDLVVQLEPDAINKAFSALQNAWLSSAYPDHRGSIFQSESSKRVDARQRHGGAQLP